jgi:hypothetical protein
MPEPILSKLVTEAMKPVSSFIDAALGPKLERIRTKAKKRELKDRLGDQVVNELLEQYFKRLLRRVSGITTIVFPQQQLPLTSIYEPMKLKRAPDPFSVAVPDKIVTLNGQDLKSGENYLIIDSAGMGKSTFAKYLVLDIFESTTKIPLFLELRRINDSDTLLEKLSKDIDEHQEDIDERFLAMLLEQGEYVIILDGYDELSEDVRQRIGVQITDLAVKFDRNTVILTSRPEVSLPPMPNSKWFGLQPLDRKQAESLVLRYDAVANISVGEGLIKHFNAVSPEFLTTPLLIVLLYRTFGYNQSIATKITSFYDDVYNAFYKGHDLSKSGFSRAKSSGLDAEDFRRLLRGFSFLLTMQQKTSIISKTEAYAIIENSIKLTSVTPLSAAAFFDDLLLSVPLFMKDGNEYRFIHKSIGDYFTGEFLAFASRAEVIIEKIGVNGASRDFSKAFEFLADLNPSLFRRTIVAPLATRILMEENPIPDLGLRTLWFIGLEKIGIETRENQIYKDTEWEDSGNHGMHFSFLDRKIKLRFEYSKNSIAVSWAAWKFISSEMNEDYSKFLTERQLVSNLLKLLEPGRLYSLNSEYIIQHSANPGLRAVVATLISIMLPREDAIQLRVIDMGASKKVLDTIREEQETQDWVNSLIGN